MNGIATRIAAVPWPTYLATVLLTYMLKRFYSHAGVPELAWILEPTANVVGWLRRQPLFLDSDRGWMPADGSFIIAPACAGVNFLILIFAVAVVGFAHRLRTPLQRGGWFVAMACTAYLLTVAINAVRIAIAVALYETDAQAGWLTPARVHRLAGTVVYLAGLWTAWALLDWLSARWQGRRRAPYALAAVAVPAAYIAMTVVVPFLNGAARQYGDRYLEHALSVSLVAASTVPLLSLIRWFTSGGTGAGDDRHGQTDDSGGRGRAGNR